MRLMDFLKYLSVIGYLMTTQSLAQRKMEPLLNIGFNHFIGEGISPENNSAGNDDFWAYLPPFSLKANGLWAQELHIGGGVRIHNKLDILFNVRVLQNMASFSDYGTYFGVGAQSIYPSPTYRSYSISFSPSYRILKGDFSPLIGIEAGTEIYSNAKGKFMSEHMILLPEVKPKMESIYNSGVFFGKARIMLEYRHKNLCFQSGVSYNYYLFSMTRSWLLEDQYYSVDYVDPTEQYATGGNYRKYHHGLGMEFNIIFCVRKRSNEIK